jgi:hypothetical protein
MDELTLLDAFPSINGVEYVFYGWVKFRVAGDLRHE